MAAFPQQFGWNGTGITQSQPGSAPGVSTVTAKPTPGTNAPTAVSPQQTIAPVTNTQFGSPGAMTSGAAGKLPITSGPNVTAGGKAGSNLKSNDTSLAGAGKLGPTMQAL